MKNASLCLIALALSIGLTAKAESVVQILVVSKSSLARLDTTMLPKLVTSINFILTNMADGGERCEGLVFEAARSNETGAIDLAVEPEFFEVPQQIQDEVREKGLEAYVSS